MQGFSGSSAPVFQKPNKMVRHVGVSRASAVQGEDGFSRE